MAQPLAGSPAPWGSALTWQLSGAGQGVRLADMVLSPGLSMRLLESRRGLSSFAFEHSEEYQQTQHRFTAAVDSMEPSNIVVRGPPRAPGPATASPPGDRLLLPGAWETPGHRGPCVLTGCSFLGRGAGLAQRHLGTRSKLPL